MTIGKNLKQLRTEKNLTQEQVAQIIGVTRQTISGWESGRTQPDIESLDRLAKAYSADIEDILYGTADNNTVASVKKRFSVFAIVLLLLSLVSSTVYFAMSQITVSYFGLTKEDTKNNVSINNIKISQEKLTEYIAKTGKLGTVWTRVDGLLLGLTALGCIYFFTVIVSSKTKIPAKKKLFFSAALATALIAIPVIIGLFDPCGKAVINYLITQRTSAAIILITAIAEICTERVKMT